jgi:hypothetical protein
MTFSLTNEVFLKGYFEKKMDSRPIEDYKMDYNTIRFIASYVKKKLK